MKTEVIKKNNTEVAVVSNDELLITDVQSALDLIMTVKYETGCTNIAVNKGAIVNDFFVLSTCLAGEILQKFINYGVRFAIYGDFSKYTGKPLRDFMYESNKGKDIYFQPTASLAVDKLSGCAKNKKETVMNADLQEVTYGYRHSRMDKIFHNSISRQSTEQNHLSAPDRWNG